MDTVSKVSELEEKLKKYEARYAEKLKLNGELVRTRFGDSFADQVRDDQNALLGIIQSIKEEIKMLKTTK